MKAALKGTLVLFLILSFSNVKITLANNDSLLLKQALLVLEEANKQFVSINSYHALIVSTEYFNGEKNETEYIHTKFLRSNSIYLKWLPGPYEGLQVSYVPKRDGSNTLLAKETGMAGWLGAVRWNEDNSLINSLYPHHFKPGKLA